MAVITASANIAMKSEANGKKRPTFRFEPMSAGYSLYIRFNALNNESCVTTRVSEEVCTRNLGADLRKTLMISKLQISCLYVCIIQYVKTQ